MTTALALARRLLENDAKDDLDVAFAKHAKEMSPKAFSEHDGPDCLGGFVTPSGRLYGFDEVHHDMLDKAGIASSRNLVRLGISPQMGSGPGQVYASSVHGMASEPQHRVVRELARRSARNAYDFHWECWSDNDDDIKDNHGSGRNIQDYERHHGLREAVGEAVQMTTALALARQLLEDQPGCRVALVTKAGMAIVGVKACGHGDLLNQAQDAGIASLADLVDSTPAFMRTDGVFYGAHRGEWLTPSKVVRLPEEVELDQTDPEAPPGERHKLWWKPGMKDGAASLPHDASGRGLVDEEGNVHTWPYGDAQHAAMAYSKGLDLSRCSTFTVNVDGRVSRIWSADRSNEFTRWTDAAYARVQKIVSPEYDGPPPKPHRQAGGVGVPEDPWQRVWPGEDPWERPVRGSVKMQRPPEWQRPAESRVDAPLRHRLDCPSEAWGSGLVEPDGTVHTWDNDDGSHAEVAMARGLDIDKCAAFTFDMRSFGSTWSARDGSVVWDDKLERQVAGVLGMKPPKPRPFLRAPERGRNVPKPKRPPEWQRPAEARENPYPVTLSDGTVLHWLPDRAGDVKAVRLKDGTVISAPGHENHMALLRRAGRAASGTGVVRDGQYLPDMDLPPDWEPLAPLDHVALEYPHYQASKKEEGERALASMLLAEAKGPGPYISKSDFLYGPEEGASEYVPAFRIKGEVVSGREGDNHGTLYARLKPEHQRAVETGYGQSGFLDADGAFFSEFDDDETTKPDPNQHQHAHGNWEKKPGGRSGTCSCGSSVWVPDGMQFEESSDTVAALIGEAVEDPALAFGNKLAAEHGATVDLRTTKYGAHLDSLIVPKERRKQGVGSEIMRKVTDWADEGGKRVTLHLATRGDLADLETGDHGTTSRNRLLRFYRRFGFVPNKGRHRDFTTNASMYRDPIGESSPEERLARKEMGKQALYRRWAIAHEGDPTEEVPKAGFGDWGGTVPDVGVAAGEDASAEDQFADLHQRLQHASPKGGRAVPGSYGMDREAILGNANEVARKLSKNFTARFPDDVLLAAMQDAHDARAARTARYKMAQGATGGLEGAKARLARLVGGRGVAEATKPAQAAFRVWNIGDENLAVYRANNWPMPGAVIPSGRLHDDVHLPAEWRGNPTIYVEDGFLDHDGKFLSRQDASDKYGSGEAIRLGLAPPRGVHAQWGLPTRVGEVKPPEPIPWDPDDPDPSRPGPDPTNPYGWPEHENDTAIHKATGLRFWGGVAHPADGGIDETIPYARAEAADFHHRGYLSAEASDAVSSGDKRFFWFDKDGLNLDTNYYDRQPGHLSDVDLRHAIHQQVQHSPQGTAYVWGPAKVVKKEEAEKHQLWWKFGGLPDDTGHEGRAGRGAVTHDGVIHTWPADVVMHRKMLASKGIDFDRASTFSIGCDGRIRSLWRAAKPTEYTDWSPENQEWVQSVVNPRLEPEIIEPYAARGGFLPKPKRPPEWQRVAEEAAAAVLARVPATSGPREYVSRWATAEEHAIHWVAKALKDAHPAALSSAAPEIAARARRGEVLVPVPDHHGDTAANRALADAVARLRPDVRVADVLRRHYPVESSMRRRQRGLPGIPAEEHERSMDGPDFSGHPRVALVDNLVSTGATAEGARRALRCPHARLLAYAAVKSPSRVTGGGK